jgi:prepilin-type N-terminal cleavage/methylation domain-containing protein
MKTKKEAGFTLIELLLVITIIGVLTGLIAVNMAGSTKKFRLKEATTQLYSDLKKCRVDAMTIANDVNTRGFGYKFSNATTYQTFEFNDVTSPSYTYTAATETLNPVTVTIPNGVQVSKYSGTLTAPFLFDRRGWLRSANWSTVSGGTYILELAGTKPRCIVLSISQIRQGVWDNAKPEADKCRESN